MTRWMLAICMLCWCVPAVAVHAADPLSVRIRGQTVGVIGDKIYFTLQETGDPKTRVWSIFPAGTVGFDTHDNEAVADFSTRFPGTYVIFVSVANGDKVAQTFHVLEMRGDTDSDAPQVADAVGQPTPNGGGAARIARPTPQEQARTKMTAVPPKPASRQEGAPERIARWTREVKSTNLSAEAQQVAAVLRQTANSITSGLLAGGDALSQAHGMTRLDKRLIASEEAWRPWWNHMEVEFWPQMKKLYGGMIPDANAAATLNNVAAILEKQ